MFMECGLLATFTVHEAKTNLSKLIERAEAGEEVIIARGSKPAVRLVAIAMDDQVRQPGQFAGLAEPDASFFFDALPADELKRWQGGES
jgi:prevent-host-death family protein